MESGDLLHGHSRSCLYIGYGLLDLYIFYVYFQYNVVLYHKFSINKIS